jgi:hypothetical protein
VGINLHENELRIYDAARPERSKRFSGAVVSGTHSAPFVIDTRELVSVIGVRFRPGGAFPFLGTPANELADAHVDLEALWGTSAIELREQLCEAKTPAERFDLLEKALVAHLFRPLERHYAVRFALDTFDRSHSGLAIRDVARDAGAKGGPGTGNGIIGGAVALVLGLIATVLGGLALARSRRTARPRT